MCKACVFDSCFLRALTPDCFFHLSDTAPTPYCRACGEGAGYNPSKSTPCHEPNTHMCRAQHCNSLTHPSEMVLACSQLCWSCCFPVRHWISHLGVSLLSHCQHFIMISGVGAFNICFPQTFVNVPLKIACH